MNKIKDGEFYWLDAPAIDEYDPVMIGQYVIVGVVKKWLVGGKFYMAGTGIDVIKHIPKPKM